jgi:hypothetical protein
MRSQVHGRPARDPQQDLSLPEILEALSLYDRGNTLEATADKISSRYGHRVAPSTISRWLSEHPTLTTYRRLRECGRRLFTPTQIIRTQKLYHRQVYEFAYHRAKLAFLRDGTLDDKRTSGRTSSSRFAALADFLEAIHKTCPHDLFQREDGSRGSQLAPDFLAMEKLIVVKKQNAATDTAALILPAVGSNYERHPKLQRFMLANDSTTVAVEVPVWLNQDDIATLKTEHGIRLLSEDAESSITGHIDFLQVRNGAVHILDYKPDARTNRPIAQLTIYAPRRPCRRRKNAKSQSRSGGLVSRPHQLNHIAVDGPSSRDRYAARIGVESGRRCSPHVPPPVHRLWVRLWVQPPRVGAP